MSQIENAKFGEVFKWSKDSHFVMYLSHDRDDGTEFWAVDLTDNPDGGWAGGIDSYIYHDGADPKRATLGGWVRVDD